MKRGMHVALVIIMALAFVGCASPGKTQYKGTVRGGTDTTTGYYRDIWAGAKAHKEEAEEAAAKKPPKDDWFPAGPAISKVANPNSNPNQKPASPIRLIVAPSAAASDMPKTAPSVFIYGPKGDELAQKRIDVGMRFAATKGIQATNAGLSDEVPRKSILVRNAYDQNISNFVPISNELARGEKQICDPQSGAILAIANVTPSQPPTPSQSPTPVQPSAPARVSTTPPCPTGGCSPTVPNAPNLSAR
jgi:hypothetical protein